VFIPAIWKVVVPPKVQLFLWLLSHNKLATVDNLKKRGADKPEQWCFFFEKESIVHLFFECVVAKLIWSFVYEFLGFSIGGIIYQWHPSGCMRRNIAVSISSQLLH
jgi:hypothetical protein